MGPLTELSLFSGVGGGLLATKHFLGWRTICYVEWNKYAIEVLKARIRDGYLDDAPIWDDANTFDGKPWAGLVDVITAGFPCQPFSVAGKGLAENDPRNGWPATIRIIREVRPRFAFLENVPGLLAHAYFGTIIGQLAEEGYSVQWDCISAEEVGAPHLRERLWIVAYAGQDYGKQYVNEEKRGDIQESHPDLSDPESQQRNMGELTRNGEIHFEGNGPAQQMADACITRWEELHPSRVAGDAGHVARSSDSETLWNTEHKGNRRIQSSTDRREKTGNIHNSQWWEVEPRLGRVADGVAHRLDRLEAIGNGQVPAVVAEAWRRIVEEAAA